MHKKINNGLLLNFCICLIGSALYFFGLGIDASQANGENAIKMSVVLEHSIDEEFILNVSLTNVANVPLNIYQGALPWEFRYNLQLLAVKAFLPEGILEEALPVVDPGGLKEIQMQPGEMLRGTISLNERFNTLSQDVKKRDIIIFWTYQLETVNGTKLDRLGGWLMIPKILGIQEKKDPAANS